VGWLHEQKLYFAGTTIVIDRATGCGNARVKPDNGLYPDRDSGLTHCALWSCSTGVSYILATVGREARARVISIAEKGMIAAYHNSSSW
jgi:hypothetical protein